MWHRENATYDFCRSCETVKFHIFKAGGLSLSAKGRRHACFPTPLQPKALIPLLGQFLCNCASQTPFRPKPFTPLPTPVCLGPFLVVATHAFQTLFNQNYLGHFLRPFLCNPVFVRAFGFWGYYHEAESQHEVWPGIDLELYLSSQPPRASEAIGLLLRFVQELGFEVQFGVL